MTIKFKSVEPNLTSIEPELIFSFELSDIKPDVMPIHFFGQLLSEDKKKLGNFYDSSNHLNLWLNATGGANKDTKQNTPITVQLSCPLSAKAINHINDYRLEKKEITKDVVFFALISIQLIESNICLSNLRVEDGADTGHVVYKYESEFTSRKTNMWFLSGNSGSNILLEKKHPLETVEIKIDLMEWINKFTEYLNIGRFIVYEFPMPDEIIFSEKLKERYEKAQTALRDMKRQLDYGEWKAAIIMSRPIVELFDKFEDFKKFLIDKGYSEDAYTELSKSIHSTYDLLSKFYHGLKKGNKDVNDEIIAYKEDAYFLYSHSISLLYLISQKLKRKQ
jgi:hypothetical protein